jgi:hypothetical protein
MSLEHASSLFFSPQGQSRSNGGLGPDALAEAKAQDKPILLSLGYIGCHWCHVMNRESFSDPERRASSMRIHPCPGRPDERPTWTCSIKAPRHDGSSGRLAAQHLPHPDGRPFWVRAIWASDTRNAQLPPPGDRHRQLLEERSRPRRGYRQQGARGGGESLQPRHEHRPGGDEPGPVGLRIGQRYDIFFGGMQGAQKFPTVLLLDLVWRAFLRTGTPNSASLSSPPWTAPDGGVYDHIGGGFFRHSMDERWFEPTFREDALRPGAADRLLYRVFKFNRNELCRQRVIETVEFLLRDMKVGDAFAASISSGSQNEDAKYYTWSEAEIDAALVGTFSPASSRSMASPATAT